MTKDMPMEEKASRQDLIELAIFLEGMAKGQGIKPLGLVHIENPWKAIRHLDNMEYFPPTKYK